ncbi:MAG: hypothetical protein R8G66_22205 [Cytophagales bacterium]|nr:hypothetical protein [Cytophagales bacterium]
MNVLAVPIRVDAFVAKTVESVVTTTDDFDVLPYVNKQHKDVNFDVANMASSIAKTPFNSYETLPKGVHLHWSMPDAMTKGKSDEHGIKMPIVPNRWLVRRIKKSTPDQVKSWMVESDYLYPDGVVPDRAIAIPAMPQQSAGTSQCQFMGRQILLDQWLQESEVLRNSHRYLPELNVLGWGNPLFSALYTSCYSVFGYYDETLSDEQVKDYTYEVYGWYANEQQDFVRQHLTKSDLDIATVANSEAQWEFELGKGQELKSMLCYGKVDFSDKAVLKDPTHEAQTKLVFAPSPPEAIATFLSKTKAQQEGENEAQAVKLENQILSLLYNADVEGQGVDFVDQLKEARHKSEFEPVSGGTLWDMLDEASLKEDIYDDTIKAQVQEAWEQAKPRFCTELAALNSLQEAKNQAEHQVAYQRRVLYNDWSKYMQTLHPVDLEGDYYPDIDILRLLMTQQSIPALEAALAKLSHLEQSVSLNKEVLQNHYLKWKTEHEPADRTLGYLPVALLEEVPAPRYWQPRDPCLLIEGNLAKTSARHGADGLLTCQVIQGSKDSILEILESADVKTAWTWDNHAVNTWSHQPWSPLLVEWSMRLFPDEMASKSIQANQYDYDPKFITGNYRIPLNDEQFGLPSSAIDLRKDRGRTLATTNQPTIVLGQALLSDTVKKVMQDRFDRFVKEHKPAPGETGQSRTIYDRIVATSDLLEETNCTLLSLDGLYDNLLMYSNLSLMDVDDPFMFLPRHADKHVTEKVKALLQGHDFKLPATGHRFTPIKSGIQKLGALQLVDTFGRYKTIETEELMRPHRSAHGNALYAPPRVLQPLRMSFRWEDNPAVAEATPIQGWLGYNVFDATVLFFDEAGTFMGHINSDGEWCNERGFMQSLSADIPRQMRLFIEKLLAFHRGNRIKKEAFLRQKGTSEKLWDQFVQLGVLRKFSDKKALLIPMTQAEWSTRIQPETGIDFAKGRGWFRKALSEKNYWPQLKQAIRRGIDNVEPIHASDQGQPGTIKPLAIVKAQLDLQMQGGPESDKSWSAVNHALNHPKRSDREYTKVQFPIKLGEYNNLDDGLIAYWQVFDKDELPADGYFPQSDMDDVEGFIDAANFDRSEHDYVDQIRAEGVANLSQSLNDRPLSVLMLMDPDAPVHATTGVVPKKSLQISPKHYRDVVGEITGRYFMAPMLSPIDETVLPLPAGESWLWESATGESGNYLAQQDSDLLDMGDFIERGGSEVDWQWLQDQHILVIEKPGRGQLQIPKGEQTNEIRQKLEALAPLLEATVQRGIIRPADVAPLAYSKVRVMEGWLSPLS